MTVTHPITVDLVQPGIKPRLYAMQFDANTRVIAVTLLCRGQSWEAPADGAFGLSYRKHDGTRGFYTHGITRAANTVSVTLAPQVLTCAGTVEAALICTDNEGKRIGAFPFEIAVAADPAAGSTASEDYFPQGCAVLYTPQNLTEAQKQQARANIGLEDAADAGQCLYNGIQLPALPQWDRERFPYAYIWAAAWDSPNEYITMYKLTVSAAPIRYGTVEGVQCMYLAAGFDTAMFNCPKEDGGFLTWNYHSETTMTHDAQVTPFWTNHDVISDANGTVHYAATDPVPVGGGSDPAAGIVVDFDQLGITQKVLELFNAGGGDVSLGSGAPADIAPLCNAFPLTGDYTAKLTIPDMGVMYVKPVYTMCDADGFRSAHFDSYIMLGSDQLTKFYVRTVRALNRSSGSEWFYIEVGFYT